MVVVGKRVNCNSFLILWLMVVVGKRVNCNSFLILWLEEKVKKFSDGCGVERGYTVIPFLFCG